MCGWHAILSTSASVRSVAGFVAAWDVAFVMLATLPIIGIAGFMVARVVQKNGERLADAYAGVPYLPCTYVHCPGRCWAHSWLLHLCHDVLCGCDKGNSTAGLLPDLDCCAWEQRPLPSSTLTLELQAMVCCFCCSGQLTGPERTGQRAHGVCLQRRAAGRTGVRSPSGANFEGEVVLLEGVGGPGCRGRQPCACL